MAKSLPPLTWFRAFECAARHLSFTGAAREMNITQSAVSQQVRLLENRLGTQMFVRKARGIALTESGRRLMPYVSGAMADLSLATEMFDPHQGDDILVIACSSSFARLWLCGHIGNFMNNQSTRDVWIVSANWPDDYTKVDSDVQIRYGSRDLVGDGAERLMQDTMLPVCHPDMESLYSGAFQGPLIHTMGTANTWGRWSSETGVDVGAIASLSVDSDELALELAENKQGIALCGEFLCRDKLESGQLSQPVPGAIVSDENYYVAIGSGRGAETAAQAFVTWLFEAI